MEIDDLMIKLAQPSKNDFFVLDIDSTLVTTHQRNQSILQDWTQQHQGDFPKDCLTLKQATCQFGDYGLRNALERIQFKEENSGSYEHLQHFWRDKFFSNQYLHADLATRGAVDWTQTLEELGVDFVYLTARHKATMWEGTLESLDNLGFPICENTLFLKDDLQDSDEDYKSKELHNILLKSNGKKVWFIDNEPVVLNKIRQDHPLVQLVWFESTHSGKMTPPEGVHSIQNFCFQLGSE